MKKHDSAELGLLSISHCEVRMAVELFWYSYPVMTATTTLVSNYDALMNYCSSCQLCFLVIHATPS